jgi:hypothetical protein
MRFTRFVAVAAGIFLVAFGLWAFAAPRSFFDQIATFPPYNRHLLHDLGAFQFGLGVTLLAALVWSDALTVGLVGVGAGSGLHAVAHWLDRNLGGRSSDPYTLTLLAVVILAAAWARRRATTRATGG